MLTAHRCRGRYGWIMIDGKNDDDAFREALRSSETAARGALQRWHAQRYVDVSVPPLLGAAAQPNARQCHYDRLHHRRRFHELRTKPDIDSEESRMLHASRAILNNEVPGSLSRGLT